MGFAGAWLQRVAVRSVGHGDDTVMGLHKLTAGDGYLYLLRQVATTDGTDLGHTSLADYYTTKGETPGRWTGSGLASLAPPDTQDPQRPNIIDNPYAVPAGSEVTEDQMTALFGEGLHPNTERITTHLTGAGTGIDGAHAAARLGRPFRLGANENEFTRRLRGAYAAYNTTLGRATNAPLDPTLRAEIRTTVGRDMFSDKHARPPLDDRELTGFIARLSRTDTTAVAGYDLTFTPVKSISALWALAPLPIAKTIEDCHHRAVADTLAYLEQHACFTRTGTNGVAQVDTTGFIAAAFDHRDSRAGDPNLHTHVAISNKVATVGPDGLLRWLALDGQPLYKANVSASELYNTLCETNLTHALGVTFAEAVNGTAAKRPVREITGIPEELLTLWSTRRAAIEHRVGQLAKDFQTQHHREPTAVELLALSQQATLETRHAKHEPRSLAEQRQQWRTEAVQVLGSYRDADTLIAELTVKPLSRRSVAVTDEWVQQQAAAVIGTVSAARATWQITHVRAEVSRLLRYTDTPHTPDLAARIVTTALQTHSIALTDHSDTERGEPAVLRRRDGTSVYTRHDTTTYTSADILAAEHRILTAAAQTGGHIVDDTSLELAILQIEAADGVPLNDGQRTLLRDMATSGARVQLALAPAGTGKTTAMAPLAAAWANSGGTVIGLAPTAAAAEVLAADLGAPTDTIDKLIQLTGTTPGPAPAADDPARTWFDRIGPNTLIVVDEAGMASTAGLDAVIAHAMATGASVRLIGDDKQLTSVSAGGILADIAEHHGALSLSDVVRFTDPTLGAAEGAASLALRVGDPTGIAFYLDHHRVHVGADHVAADMAYTAWAEALSQGRDALLIAPTNDLVAELNERARLDRLRREPPAANARTVTLADGCTASVGDWILTRSNARWLHLPDGGWVKNGHRWTITDIDDDGTLTVTRHTTDANKAVRLPARYAATNTTLGYARTINSAQGSTARHECHIVGADTLTRQQLYVALTRGKAANHIYFSTSEADPHRIIAPKATHPPTAVDILTTILARDGAQYSAHHTSRTEHDPWQRLSAAADIYTDALTAGAEQLAGPTTMARIDTAATTVRPDLTDAEAWPVLRRSLALLALDGHDPETALTHAAARPLGDVTDPAAVLTWRLPTPAGSALDSVGPLRWLPAIPQALRDNPQWNTYLNARAELVTTLADQIRDQARTWTPATAPAWARPLVGQRPALLAEIAVFRAAHSVEKADTRITGPDQHTNRAAAFQTMLHQRLDTALTNAHPGAQRWRALADRLDPRIATDPYWTHLATHLDAAARAGADITTLLTDALDRHGPLPYELPAAALWWRLAGTLAPATLEAPNTRLRPPWTAELHRILGTGATEAITADPAWPALVAAVNASDWPPAQLLSAAAEYLLDALGHHDIRPDEYARLLTYRTELLTHHHGTLDRDIPHPADTSDTTLDHQPPDTIEYDDDLDAPPDVVDYDYGVDDYLGDLDFDALPTQRPIVTPDERLDITELRARRDAARAHARALATAIFTGAGGPAEAAAASELADLHARHQTQRPFLHDLAHTHAEWVAAQHLAEAHHHRLAHLDHLAQQAYADGDTALAAAHTARRDTLAADTFDLTVAVQQTRAARDTALAALLSVAGGPEHVVTDDDIHTRRRRALDDDITTLTAARREARDLDNQLVRAEGRVAQNFAATTVRSTEQASPTHEIDLAALRSEIDYIASSGARSLAVVYPAPEHGWDSLDEPTRAVVTTLTASMQSIQILTVHPDADKQTALSAVTAAAHGAGKHVLAMPATDTAAAYAQTHPYAEATATPATTRERLESGAWTIPAGHLLVIDDADQIDPKQLRYFTDHAAHTNTKLLLVTNPSLDRTPAHTLTDLLADNLPWAQHLGTPGPERTRATEVSQASEYLADHRAETNRQREAVSLIARRDELLDDYRELHTPGRTPSGHDAERNHGVEL
jgi:conjugative relaxase-like TrwC/TraI family protein